MVSELETIRKRILVLELITKIESMGVQWTRISPNQFKTTIVQNNQVWDLFFTKSPQNKTVIDFRKNMSFFYSISSDDQINLLEMFSDLEDATPYYKDKRILQHLGGLPVVVGSTFNIKPLGGVKINSNTLVVSYYSPLGSVLLSGVADVFKGYITRGGVRGGSRATVTSSSNFNVLSYGVTLSGEAIVGYEEAPLEMDAAGVIVAGQPVEEWIYNPVIISCGILLGGMGKLDSSIDEYSTGGVAVGSSAINEEIYYYSVPSAGLLISGISSNIIYSSNIPSGGVLGSGDSPNTTVNNSITITGGLLINGTAKLDSSIDEYPSGGVRAGGVAEVTEYDIYPVSSNGVVCNGLAINTQEFNSITISGGVICNGDSLVFKITDSIVVSGGVICAGLARVTECDIYVVVVAGVVGNGATITTACYNPSVSGGAICGSSTIVTEEINISTSGGVLCNSNTDYYVITQRLTSGGVVCSSSAIVMEEKNPAVSGGVVCGSSAIVMEEINPVISGGAVCNGLGKQDNSMDEFPTGGVICGSLAIVDGTTNIPVSGGIICGSSAIVMEEINPVISGGVLCNSNTDYYVVTQRLTSGGVVCGSSAIVMEEKNPVTSGGVLCNSNTDYYVITQRLTSGGVICAGLSEVTEYDIYPVGSYGVLCAGVAFNEKITPSSIERIGIATFFNVSGATGSINFGLIGTIDALTDDLMVVCVATEWASTVGTISADFEGNPFSGASAYTVNGISLRILHLPIESDIVGGTLTVSFSQTNQGAAATAFIVRGLSTRTVDITKTNTGTSTTPSVDNTNSVNQSNDFCQAMLVLNDPDGVIGTWQDSFTESFKKDENNTPSSENFYYADAYRILSSITEPNPNLIDCTNAEWMMLMVVFS